MNVEVIRLETLLRRRIEHVLTRPQRLDFHVMMLFTAGAGRHHVDFRVVPYDDRTLLMLRPGQIQRFEMDPGATGFLLVFTADFIYRNSTDTSVSQCMRIFDHSLENPRWHLEGPRRELFGDLFRGAALEYEASAGDHLTEELLRHWTRLILLQAERMRLVERPGPVSDETYTRFMRLRALVHRDMAASRMVAHYARLLGTTDREINRLTRVVVNKTAKEFIDAEIICEAKRLLSQDAFSIKEAAYGQGFSEPTNWIKFFRRHTGMSPTEYRTSHRGE
jgi:AraC-like DNA-binding protein